MKLIKLDANIQPKVSKMKAEQFLKVVHAPIGSIPAFSIAHLRRSTVF